jgi:hypothetical protein
MKGPTRRLIQLFFDNCRLIQLNVYVSLQNFLQQQAIISPSKSNRVFPRVVLYHVFKYDFWQYTARQGSFLNWKDGILKLESSALAGLLSSTFLK